MELPNVQEMHYLLSRLSKSGLFRDGGENDDPHHSELAKSRQIHGLSEGLLEHHMMERLLFESCTRSPARSEELGLATLKALTEGKIDLETSNTTGKAALHIAIEICFVNHTRVLLKSGANPIHRDDRGSSALHAAVSDSTNTAKAKKWSSCFSQG